MRINSLSLIMLFHMSHHPGGMENKERRCLLGIFRHCENILMMIHPERNRSPPLGGNKFMNEHDMSGGGG